jgi:hypothetical protein
MPTDQLVTAEHVLNAVMQLERRGATKELSELETLEPSLAEYVLEGLTRLHHKLADLGLSAQDVRKLYRQTEKLLLVSILALRHAQRDLWDDSPEPPAQSSDGPSADPP